MSQAIIDELIKVFSQEKFVSEKNQTFSGEGIISMIRDDGCIMQAQIGPPWGFLIVHDMLNDKEILKLDLTPQGLCQGPSAIVTPEGSELKQKLMDALPFRVHF